MKTCYMRHIHFNPLNAELNPICHMLALLRAHHILHVNRIRVNIVCDSVAVAQMAQMHIWQTFV